MARTTATTEASIGLPEEAPGQYVLLPAWVLVPQVFLAFGWLRAAVGHAIRPEWWSGQDLRDFIADQSGGAILGYNYFLEGAILSIPSVIAGVVFALQFIIGVALFFNWRPVMALSLGAFLNVNFMLAGVVNPSIFYLVMAAGIAAWRMDEQWSAEFKATVARRFGPVAFLISALLLTGVQSVHPGTVTEDPAAVLIFFLLILVAVTWSLYEYDRPKASSAVDVPDETSAIVDRPDVEPVDSDGGDGEVAETDNSDSDSGASDDTDSKTAVSDADGSEATTAESSESGAADSHYSGTGDSGSAAAEGSDTEPTDSGSSEPDAEDSTPADDGFALVDKS